MANDSVTTVLSIVAWGTRLTFGLYDFSAAQSAAPASEDVNRLAKEVNLLSQVLRQIGSRLKEDGSLPSQEAFNTVRQTLDQCQDVFREVESLVPLNPSRQNSQDGSALSSTTGSMSPWREDVEWNVLSQARAKYLLAHLEALRFTMSVMLQTLYTAKSIIWSNYERNQTASDAVVVEKSQMEILVVEQQLALLRAYRTYESFKRHIANAPLLCQSPKSQALIRRDEHGPNPRALVLYQEPTLAQTPLSANEADDLPKVRMVSSPYVDLLLSRWTRINTVEERLRLNERPREEPRREKFERRNWQAPAVESDWETEAYDRRGPPPTLRLTTDDPVLMHIDEERTMPSPIPAGPRPSSLQPHGPPFSPQSSKSWGPTSGGYFPQHVANGSRRHMSPGPSPLSSPRASFSDGLSAAPRSQSGAKGTGSDPRPQSPKQASKLAPIPYRLRINQWYWDYEDADLIGSNSKMSPHTAIKTVSKDTMPITEIFQEYVSREAIRQRGYEYTRVMRERVVNGRKQEDQCYCIEGALRPDQVQRLVELTERIRNPRASTRSPRSSRGGPASSAPAPPPLDRSHTAPVYGNKFRETHSGARDYESPSSARGKTSSGSSTSDDDTSSSYVGSSSRSKSRSRRDSGREYDERGTSWRKSSRDRDKRSGGGGKAQTLTKIAAGAGLATLLDGLPEMLSYL
ncbi:uncharacterized protein PV09_07217 [Verruconis gallopava]|uniref:DUF8035 domain-containing protein n=1 Tax=Verruconis gallopava TaxID=253628 RepID=A0A0D2A4R6_9PEZI|nr:uncharacterized protein PV09_07217 [Verruconis gallopava]KIW01460.1 hypothetical protein PV09_07217 [Verruconis gallopava]